LTIRNFTRQVNGEMETASGYYEGMERQKRPLKRLAGAALPRAVATFGMLVCVAFTMLVCASAQQAQRIVSTAPSITETLFALGLGQRVVGVSQYCEWPAEVKQLPKVGTYIQPNIEAIVRLRPDLVLLERASNEVANRLQSFGIRYAEVPHGSLAETFAGMNVIARAAGAPERGTVLVSRLQAGLEAIRQRAATLPKVRVIMIVDRRPGTLEDLIAVGPGNYENELIEAAGGENVLAHAGLMSYPRIALETVLRENPEVIVDLTDAHDTDAQHIAARASDKALWMQQTALQAARFNRIFLADSTVFVVPGPRMVEAAQRLFDAFHSGAARSSASIRRPR
jgi:iron complex transport system substrate-binding protein